MGTLVGYAITMPEGYRMTWFVCEHINELHIDEDGDEIYEWRGPTLEHNDDIEYLMDKYEGQTVIFCRGFVEIEDDACVRCGLKEVVCKCGNEEKCAL